MAIAMPTRLRALFSLPRRYASELYGGVFILRVKRGYYPSLETTSSSIRRMVVILDMMREGASDWRGPIRQQADLQVPQSGNGELVVLAASRLGTPRLIDNLEIRV